MADKPFPSSMGKRIRRTEERKLESRDADRLIGIWGKRGKKASDGKAIAHYQLTDAQSLSKGYFGKNFHQVLLMNMTLYELSGHLGRAVPAVFPHNLLPIPNLLVSGGIAGGTALTLFKCCSVAAKTLMCQQHCFGHKSKTQLRMGCYEEN